MATFQAKAFQTVQSKGYANAKRLADLKVKQSAEATGKVTEQGLKDAIAILSQWQFSDDEKTALQAQNAIQSWENDLVSLSVKKSKLNRTVAQFKNDEREIFYITPTSGDRAEIMRDIPEMASQISEELNLHLFAVENAIEEARLNDESTGELESYLFDVQRRARLMSELTNDYINGEISVGEKLNGYGLYVDTDPNDGEMVGVMIAPKGNLPPGVDEKNFQQIDSSASIGEGYLPILGTVTDDGLGMKTVKIGNQTWDGTGNLELQYNKGKSLTPQFKNAPGEFTLSNVVDKGATVRPNTFMKGYTGKDDAGNPKMTTFYAGEDGKLYSVDDKSLESFRGDPILGQKLKQARTVESTFAKGLSAASEPLNYTPFTPEMRESAQEQIRATATTPPPAPLEEPRQSFFENRTNRPNKPDEPTRAATTPDIIESGKAFFRDKIQGFFVNK